MSRSKFCIRSVQNKEKFFKWLEVTEQVYEKKKLPLFLLRSIGFGFYGTPSLILLEQTYFFNRSLYNSYV